MKKIVFLFAALLAPCAFAEDAPDWINGSSMEYPREKYLIGVGMADDRQAAEERARAEIARVFSTQVSVNLNLSESETNLKRGSDSDSASSQSVSESIKATSSKLLEGVEIADNWENKTTRQHYALAVLERAKAVNAMNEKLSAADSQIKLWRAEFEKAREKFPRVKAAMKIFSLLKSREALNSELRILDPYGRGKPSNQAEELKPVLVKAVQELDISVQTDGDGAQEMETGIINALTEMNFEARQASSGGPADIAAEARVIVEPLEPASPDDKWKWARATATVSLKDAATGKVFSQFQTTDRQASAVYEEARQRSLFSVARIAAAKTGSALTDYFENR